MSTMATGLVLGVLVIAFVASLIRHRADQKHLHDLRREARNAIAEVRVTSADPQLALNGSTATIDRLEETGGFRGIFDRRANLSVAAFVRNSAGERFVIRWHSQSARQPFVKHLGRGG